jgi:hypothetical protein
VHGLIDPFYEPAQRAIEPGHIWCDQPIYMPPRHGIKIDRVDPTNDTELEFEICGRTADTFNHPPVHSLHLESSEALVAARTKRDRPVIVIGGTTATEIKPGITTLADTVIVVPVYGADQFDKHTRRRISYYEFTNAFYLPAHKSPAFDEGFARLDHVQSVSQKHLTSYRGLKLSHDALDALIEWFIHYTTDRLPAESLILDYRTQMLKTLGE